MSDRDRYRRLACTVVIMIAGLIGDALGTERLRAQSAAGPAFERATVRPNHSNSGGSGLFLEPDGQVRASNVTLRMLIAAAYGGGHLRTDRLPVFGGPEWLDSARFDVLAKAAGYFVPGPDGPSAELVAMLRTLLADRFGLVVHREMKELPLYGLVLTAPDSTRGPRLTPSARHCDVVTPPAAGVPADPACGMRVFPGYLAAGGTTMTDLATALSRQPGMDRMVVDRTGLAGTFDLEIWWTPDPDASTAQSLTYGLPPLPPSPASALPARPASPGVPVIGRIVAALQEQLGLTLTATPGAIEVLVIDHVKPPTVGE